jgi:hypothetical protein
MERAQLRPWGLGVLATLMIVALVIASSAAGSDTPGEPEAAPGDDAPAAGEAMGPFSLTAPAGWVMNRRPGAGVRRHTVFYPRGSGGADAPVKIFVNTSPRSEGQTLEALVAQDVASTLEREQGAKVSEGTSLRTADDKLALVRSFSGGDEEESVAYIAEKDSFVLITLSARDELRHAEGESALRAIVESYRAVGR